MEPYTWALLSFLALGTACGGDSGPSGTPPAGPPPPPTPTNAVDVNDNFFTPAAASVGAGATVTWTWRGNNPHTVTFEDNQGSLPDPQTSGNHSRSVAAAGTFRYRCRVHSANFDSGMVGTLVVQ